MTYWMRAYRTVFGACTLLPGIADTLAAEPQALREIVVTAQKRPESAQNVPSSLTVFDADSLKSAGVAELESVAMHTPGFTMNRFNLGEPQLYIRGVGSNTDSAAGDPTVGVFLDEIYVGRISGAAFDFYDLERVEVLKGPQGTLYGRNTSGGAINVVPKLPSRDLAFESDLDLGNYDLVSLRGVLNGPVGDRSAARASVSYRNRGGYSENIVTGDDLDDERSTSARLQWQTDVSEETRWRVAAEWSENDNSGQARVPGPIFTDQTGTDAIATAALLRLWPLNSDVRKSHSNAESFEHRRIAGATGRLEHDSDYGQWTLLAGVRSVDLDWYEDLDGVKPFGNPPLPGVPPSTYGWIFASQDRTSEDAEQRSIELRLTSQQDTALRWVGGLYYFDEEVERSERFVTRFSLVPAASGDVTFAQDAQSASAAAFGEVSWPILNALRTTLGLRYTRDEKDIRQQARNNDPADTVPGLPLFPGQPYDIAASDGWDSITGRAGLEYRRTEDMLMYASIDRGFKSGIFPSQNNVIQAVGTATPPERVLGFELGAKTEWLAHRLRVNASIFSMDYEDLQLFRLDPQLRLITFTEDATIRGAEIETLALLRDNVLGGLTVSYLDAEVSKGTNAGSDLPRAPGVKVGTFAEYRSALAGRELAARAEYLWTDSYHMDVPNVRTSKVPSYGLLDARVSLQLSSSLELAVWGRNLTERTYPVNTISFLGNGFSLYGPPRTFGISIEWKPY